MASSQQQIWVYAHWKGMPFPKCIGILSASFARGKQAFQFSYDKEWLHSEEQLRLDPDIGWYSGPQYPSGKDNFGIFLDSMPDRWGRTLLQRRAAQQARIQEERPPRLSDIDYLLGVYDESRMGALRFKTAPNGPFLDDNPEQAVPPISKIRTLQYAAYQLEGETTDETTDKWLEILLAPGSSLGGARPKANVLDEKGEYWIAKFPSRNDDINKGAWEYLAHILASKAGIEMAPCKIERIQGKHHTFFTKRFDREGAIRIHFASAMTMLGYNEELLRDQIPSYLELAEFLQFNGTQVKEQLHQLWKRIILNIAISNTDDHLRNHGFLLSPNGWQLSPAFDLNPSIDKRTLSLNINMEEGGLDLELATEVSAYFQVSASEATYYIHEVRDAVQTWRTTAEEIGISRQEQERMAGAFLWG
jgi:serine/threonine-protein kinase HipA